MIGRSHDTNVSQHVFKIEFDYADNFSGILFHTNILWWDLFPNKFHSQKAVIDGGENIGIIEFKLPVTFVVNSFSFSSRLAWTSRKVML